MLARETGKKEQTIRSTEMKANAKKSQKVAKNEIKTLNAAEMLRVSGGRMVFVNRAIKLNLRARR